MRQICTPEIFRSISLARTAFGPPFWNLIPGQLRKMSTALLACLRDLTKRWTRIAESREMESIEAYHRPMNARPV